MKNVTQYITEKIKLSDDRFITNVSDKIQKLYDLFVKYYENDTRKLVVELQDNVKLHNSRYYHDWEYNHEKDLCYTAGTFPLIMFYDNTIQFVDETSPVDLKEMGYDVKTLIVDDAGLSLDEWKDLKQQLCTVFKTDKPKTTKFWTTTHEFKL
jgi:hypothetical protein